VSILSAFQKTLLSASKRTAVVCGEHKITYKALDELCNSYANEIVSRGIKPGNLIGIAANQSIDTVIGVLAIIKTGCAYVPLPDYYPKDRLNTIIDIAKISLVMGTVNDLPKAKVETIPYSHHEGLDDKNIDFTAPDITPESVAYVMFTSGSTGTPKGVVVPHRGVTRLVIEKNYMILDSNKF